MTIDPLITIPPRQVSILAGASGSGKTTLLTQEIQAWSKGEDFTGVLRWDSSVKRIAYLVADRTMSEVLWRLERLGVGDEHIEVYGIQDDLNFRLDLLKTPITALRSAVGMFKKPFQMLVIDPIALFIEDNTNDFHSVAISLMKMGRMAIEKNLTVFATHHATKTRTDFGFKRPQDRISGSGAFQGYSGTQMVLIEGREDDVPYDTLWVIPHLGRAESVTMTRETNGDFKVYDLVAAIGERADQVKEFVRGLDDFSVRDVHAFGDDLMIAHATVRRLLGEMLDQKEIIRVGRGLYRKNASNIEP